MEKINAYIDSLSESFKHPIIGKESQEKFEKELLEKFSDNIPEMIGRYKSVGTFFTIEIGDYLGLLIEAKQTYVNGLYYSTVAMIGITAERFALDLSKGVNIDVKRSLKKHGQNQEGRLKVLKLFNLIEQGTFQNLEHIRKIRNNYIHSKNSINPKEDSIIVLNKMIDVINIEFNSKYGINNGAITLKKK